MSGGRLKVISLVGIALLAALIFAAWSQTWFTLTVQGKPFPVSGQVAGGALSALALASLALIAALAIAGRFFRPILGVLLALLGVCVIAVTGFAIGNPAVVAMPAITKVTGVAGTQSVARLVTGTSITVWPIVALVLGILMTLWGLVVAPTSRSWPDSGRKYTRSRMVEAHSDAQDPVQEWDALSEGDDPTG